VLKDPRANVIALGGGTWTIPANRTLIALHDCLTVWLDAPFELCWKRINDNSETIRPMAPDRVTGEARFALRAKDYVLAERQIAVTESDSAETIAGKILGS
jgi:shikimate kinase